MYEFIRPGKHQARVPLDSRPQVRHADGGDGSDCDLFAFCAGCWPTTYAEDEAQHRADVAA